MFKPIYLLFTLLSFFSCNTSNKNTKLKSLYNRNGQKINESLANSDQPAWTPLKRSDGITGIGALGTSFVVVEPDICTAFLVGSDIPTAPAYAVTNAHCNFFQHLGTDMLRATEVRINQATDSFIVMNHFVQVPEEKRVKIEFLRLAYITESDIDLAVFETKKTVAEVKAMGFQPLKLSSVKPKIGTPIRLIGIPLRTRTYDKQSLHISSCTVGEEVALKNGIYSAPHSVKHKCSSIPGFSGGPMLAGDNSVVLINSHGADDFSNDPPCSYETMPCEVQKNGKTIVDKDMNYAQYVDGISGCFSEVGLFDLSRTSCKLPR